MHKEFTPPSPLPLPYRTTERDNLHLGSITDLSREGLILTMSMFFLGLQGVEWPELLTEWVEWLESRLPPPPHPPHSPASRPGNIKTNLDKNVRNAKNSFNFSECTSIYLILLGKRKVFDTFQEKFLFPNSSLFFKQNCF